MAARTALLRIDHDNRLVMLGWAPPLIALGLFAAVGVARHTENVALEKGPAASETSALAGGGSAILSHAQFH